ncbi:MAG TPA: GAF domain-containing protein [Bryobacteraceae bacterium]|nr:GAF domain-containing protein [Bryobacteraceae bacterium]
MFCPSFGTLRRPAIALLVLFYCLPSPSRAQQRSAEIGYPYIRNFGPSDFKAPEPTWATIQDSRGLIYVGNQAGALEYDGVSWNVIPTRKKTYVRTFAKDPHTGRIWVGSSGDFGYLDYPDKSSQLTFVSLLDKVPQADRDFTDIWSAIFTEQGVYFLAHSRLFRYVSDSVPIKVWRPKARFGFASYVRGHLYVSDATEGMLRLEHDNLVPVPGFRAFTDSPRLILMPYGTDKILVADRGPDPPAPLDSPLLLYDGAKLTRFTTQADRILIEHRITIGQRLENGTFAIGTTGGGVVILDPSGRLLWQIDRKTGILDDNVYSIYPDQDGLWVNLAEGLSRVELPPPMSYFGSESGLEGAKLNIVRHLGSLYVGTTNGVYKLDAPGSSMAHFVLIGGTANSQAAAMLSVRDGAKTRLIVGSSGGVFEIVGDKVASIIARKGARSYSVTCLAVSKQDPNRVFVGLDDGLASIRLAGGRWIDEGKFKNVLVGKRVQRIVELTGGQIWLATDDNGVVRVDVAKLGADGIPDGNPPLREFDPEGGGGMSVFELGGKLLFTSSDLAHLYRLDPSSGKFSELAKDDPLASAPADPKQRAFGFQEDNKGNIWTFRGRELVLLKKSGEGYKRINRPFAHTPDFGSLSSVFPEDDGVTWFGSLRSLIRYDSANVQSEEMKFAALIRHVTANPGAKGESQLYGGRPPQPVDGEQQLDSTYKTVRFEFAGPISSDESATEFQSYLEGLNDGWSEWGKETNREFTNLPYRSFKFHVRARNALGQQSKEAIYSFAIAPPFYRTWWAYGAYALLLVAALWAGAQAQRRLVTLRERKRARFRTEALEAEARALNAEKGLLTELSAENTSLDFETIFVTLYGHVKDLCDAQVFRAGRLFAEEHRLEYGVVMERSERRPAFSIDTSERNRTEVLCIENREVVLMGNAPQETNAAVVDFPSRLYVPLISQGKVRGLVLVESPGKDAFTQYHRHLLQNLTAYASIALDNADAYGQLNSTLENLERTVEERTNEISQQAKDLKQAYDTVESLSEIGKQITASLDLDTVVDRLYRYVSKIADASVFGVGILVAEDHKIEYRLAFKKGRCNERYEEDTRDPNRFGVWCIEHRQPIVMNDAESEYVRYIQKMDRGVANLDGRNQDLSPASIIYLPLITQDQGLGVLTIQSFEKNAYSEYHVNLLKNLAAYISIAIDNATAYRRLNEREREIHQRAVELETVNAVGQAAASKLEVHSLIDLVGNKVREVFGAQMAYLALHDRATGMIRFPYGYGREFPPVPLGRGMTSRILMEGNPLLINEDSAGRPYNSGGPGMDAGVTSSLGVPISAGGEIVGVIGVQIADENRLFTESDLRLLATIAANVGVALHNARLFEEAAQARAAAEAADATKSAFLSTVSHELRTPLTSVLGFAKIIKRRLGERLFPLIPQDDKKIVQTMKQVADNLDVVVSEGERLTKLIDEVLDLAKIEAGKLEWRMESLSASEIIDRAMAATSSLVENKPVKLIADVAADLPRFTGDRDRLIQVVINLISNSVKFTREGSVTCRAWQSSDDLVISVVDTGLGIAPDDQPKVFEKFKQVGDTLTDKPKGTGLGLPICKEIVEHHGGHIWVESEVGKGSSFFFSLPLKAEHTTMVQPLSLESLVKRLRETVTEEADGAGRQRSILVVDDDPHIRELLRQEFQEAGHLVRLASDGREALNSIRDDKPGLVVLDVMMPEMNGFDVAAVLRNDPMTMDIPIIMLSIVEDKERGHRLGIDRYLTKPVDTKLLFREVDTLMKQGKSKKRVMIVDEDASTVRTLAEALEFRGYHVVGTTGDDLLQQALSVKPDVIILNSVLSSRGEVMQTLRFENGLENVLFLIYQ